MDFAFRNRICRLDGAKRLMGIINATPDSFSDGGVNFAPDNAFETAIQMERDGADFLDIGGESTRPGFTPVAADEEIQRVVPVIKRIRSQSAIPISVDTSKAAVAEAALAAGADIINDVSALSDSEMPAVIAKFRAGCILMHHDSMETCEDSRVPAAIAEWLRRRLATAMQATGLPETHFCMDPGIGFGKSVSQTLEILKAMAIFREVCQRPVLLAISRKSFIGAVSGESVASRRDSGSIAAALAAWQGFDICRAHNIPATLQAFRMAAKLLTPYTPPSSP